MPHPFQCIAGVKPQSPAVGVKSYLLAACGPKLLSMSMGYPEKIVSQWTSDSAGTAPVEVSNENGADGEERPAKKQKTTAKAPPALTNIIKLAVSPDQQHVVAVTEDKCVRVFSVSQDGTLTELSQRTMPKRPCALEILPDNDTIIVGDKFGDVYSLPLLPTDESEKAASDAKAAQDAKDAEARAKAQGSEQPFKPAATNLTVHTQRNLRSLEAQQNQKLFTPRKEALAFEHKLLLGHVSMLTDATFATREVDGKTRGYIISADRDEHIRISRAAPQSHIIEGFCLGHKEFVSKLCLVPGTDLLLSGGGDDWIGVWDWPTFTLKNTIDLRKPLAKYLTPTPEDKDPQIAVSGIWALPNSQVPDNPAIIITCEKVPVLLFLSAKMARENKSPGIVDDPLHGRFPLDVAEVNGRLRVSLDSRAEGQDRIISLNVAVNEQRNGDAEVSWTGINSSPTEQDTKPLNDLTGIEEDPKSLNNLLYSVRNLKKRTGWDQPEEQQQE